MPDLRACALVSRSWVDRAQSHIFWKIDIGHLNCLEILWERLQRTLETSPHLIRYIRRLRIGLDEQTPLSVLSRICNFAFTHLECVRTHIWGNLILQTALSFQRLFGLPTLRYVKLIVTRTPDSGSFPNIFERCSPAVRQLHLHFSGDLPPSLPGIPRYHARAPIRLVSLGIKTSGSLNPQLLPTLHPFSLSHLKALSISSLSGIAWDELAPIMGTIEILSIIVQRSHTGLDLSAFPRLSVLCIEPVVGLDDSIQANIIETIVSTIMPASKVHTVVVPIFDILPNFCDVLDTTLSQLPLPTVDVQVRYAELVDEASACFPRLSAASRVRTCLLPRNFDWWEDITSRL
ncbi:hypothetical protein MVEN_01120000 [Mycena venus]|uniref:F-box domain-containing protein n=1 Tax=Mycena venus TaxID=2733690 RepID=A0A8H6Y8X1_9AGAR|nr:hypothetical protein MVEN_01120000 [Mycena venus]